jgi:hypothetical protein
MVGPALQGGAEAASTHPMGLTHKVRCCSAPYEL